MRERQHLLILKIVTFPTDYVYSTNFRSRYVIIRDIQPFAYIHERRNLINVVYVWGSLCCVHKFHEVYNLLHNIHNSDGGH